MLNNPHLGTDLEVPWEQGFAAGFLVADTDLSPPSPLPPEAQQAYSEGVQAGRFSINGMRVPPTTPPREVGTWESLVEFATEHKVEEELLELAKEGAKKALGREVAGSFTLGSALFSLISVAVFGPDRSEPFFDEAALGALQRVAEQITRQAVADNNLELFLAACDRSDHNLGNDDEFFRQGFWHGRVFLDFEPAKREAMAHNHPGDAIVFRFQTASPGLVDAIELDGG